MHHWGCAFGGVYVPCIFTRMPDELPVGDSSFCCGVCMTPFNSLCLLIQVKQIWKFYICYCANYFPLFPSRVRIAGVFCRRQTHCIRCQVYRWCVITTCNVWTLLCWCDAHQTWPYHICITGDTVVDVTMRVFDLVNTSGVKHWRDWLTMRAIDIVRTLQVFGVTCRHRYMVKLQVSNIVLWSVWRCRYIYIKQ